ncbi:MAG: endonuclease/exonuclease/phosphatase family protein [Bacteriovoracia bacterium]
MTHIKILLLSLIFSLSAFANETELNNWLIEQVPEAKAYSSQGQAQNSAFNPKSIKALVWNIKKSEEDGWQAEFLNYTRNRSLFLLQEVYQTSHFQFTQNFFPQFRFDMTTGFKYKGTNTGVMNASIVRPSQIRFSHSVDTEPVVNTPKANIFTKYPIKGMTEELLVISIHGINLTGFDTFKRHMQQIIRVIKEHQGPVLWAGDFNTRTKERTEYLMQQTKELGMTEVKFINGDKRMAWILTKNYLDHAFVRGLQVKHAEVIANSKGSDHKPMILDLFIPDASERISNSPGHRQNLLD